MNRSYDLSRFVDAHKNSYETALNEIKNGHKDTHWMWYIFPQIKGLGYSTISKHYAIQSPDEAKAFLDDEYLGGHLKEISNELMKLDKNDPIEIFGRPDYMKLMSSMTLFAYVSDHGSVFHNVLDKYFNGNTDPKTIYIIKNREDILNENK